MTWTLNFRVHHLDWIKIWQPQQVIRHADWHVPDPQLQGIIKLQVDLLDWIKTCQPQQMIPNVVEIQQMILKFHHIQTCKSTWQDPQLQGLIKLQDFYLLDCIRICQPQQMILKFYHIQTCKSTWQGPSATGLIFLVTKPRVHYHCDCQAQKESCISTTFRHTQIHMTGTLNLRVWSNFNINLLDGIQKIPIKKIN